MFRIRKFLLFNLLSFVLIFSSTTGSAQTHQIGVVVHLIYDSSNPALDEAEIQPSIDRLNVNQAFGDLPFTNIEFIVIDIQSHNDPSYTAFTESQLDDIMEDYNVYENDAINLYFVPNIINGSGFATLPKDIEDRFNNTHMRSGVVVDNSAADTPTVPHEFGHFFGLVHTDATGSLPTDIREVPFEHPNWGSRQNQGDLIGDTPAEPRVQSSSNYDSNCDYNGPTFYQEPLYRYDKTTWSTSVRPTGTNFMTVLTGDCRTKFTTGQKALMDSVLRNASQRFPDADRSYLLNKNWIKFTNTDASEDTDLGGEFKIDNSTINSSSSFPFANTVTSIDIETMEERFQSSNVKHVRWNTNNELFLQKRSAFNPTLSSGIENARFDTMNVFTISNNFISSNGSGGTIEFKDPWYVDANGDQLNSFVQFNSPHIPKGKFGETSGGVFLDKFPDIGNPNIPYYTIRADETAINGVSYFLENWTGSNVSFGNANSLETSIVVTANNATATANFKGHLASNTVSATSGNSSRKVVVDGAGHWHAVYVDNNAIYYTTSTNSGSTWSNEEKLWQGTSTSPVQSPTIATSGGFGTNYYHVAFDQKVTLWGTSWHKVIGNPPEK